MIIEVYQVERGEMAFQADGKTWAKARGIELEEVICGDLVWCVLKSVRKWCFRDMLKFDNERPPMPCQEFYPVGN